MSTRSTLGTYYQGTGALLFTLGGGREAIAERETALRYHCETSSLWLLGLELSHVWVTYINRGMVAKYDCHFAGAREGSDINRPLCLRIS